jgi:transposase
VRESLRTDPFSGVVYVFRAKRADRVKLIFWDGSGVVLVAKRLENGQFRWPAVCDGVVRLSAAASLARRAGLATSARAAAHTGAERGELSAEIAAGRRQKPIARWWRA